MTLKRRCFPRDPGKLDVKIADILNKNPVTIPLGASLEDSMKLMEDRPSQISVLPVIDLSTKECVGLVRLHDIYQSRLY